MDLVRLYQRMPYALKVVAASVRGRQLRRWRYSSGTERMVADALDRDHWTRERWNGWREEQVARVLHRAATRVPYYRAYWESRRRRGSKDSFEDLEHWPVLTKETVRDNPRAFVADDRQVERLYEDHTGGTTGAPTLVYLSRDTVRYWYAMFEARFRRWNGVSFRERWGMFGGRRIVDLARTKPPFWVHNYGLGQLYLSIFHIKRETARDYVAAMRAFAPTHLVIFPSAVSVLARYMVELDLEPPRLHVIISNSEKVLPEQRRVIEAAFRCRLVDTYGMAEVVSAASECSAGTMHHWPDVGITELYDREHDRVISDGDMSELVLTGLVNSDMPLIRYLNGDLGSVPRWMGCACGRTLPHLGTIHGRSNDLIVTADGRKLYLLDSLFNDLPLVEAQLVQDTVTSFLVRLVPARGFDPFEVSARIERLLRQYVGHKIEVRLEVVSAIAKNPNGKFSPYVSRLRT